MNPFEFVNSINYSKQDLMLDPNNESKYNSYMVNRSLSYFNDTVLIANEMNIHWEIDKKLQYHFLLNIIRKRKRFSRFIKPEVNDDIEVVKKYYGYSDEKAQQVLPILTSEQITIIRKKVSKGGRK